MDIASTLNKPASSFKRRHLLWGLLLPLTAMAFLALSYVGSEPTLTLDSLRIATVKRGDFSVEVAGYGRLKAKYQRLLTSQTQAIVESILLYPGAKVSADSIIMTLSDPQLEQALATARLELARQQAQFNELVLANKSELLERDAAIAILNSSLENARLRVEAEQQLIDEGIVGALDFRRTQLEFHQLSQRLEIEAARKNQLQAMQQERLKINQDLITQYRLNYESIQRRVEALQVRAGLDGILQSLPVEIGQSLAPGAQLAMVGSDRALVAQLRVQQNQADQIAIGMDASIQTTGNEIAARVVRIDPVVTEGRVMVELDLLGELPTNARPDLTVEGDIKVKEIPNVLFVEPPMDVAGFQAKHLFRLNGDQSSAMLTQIEFGTLSGNLITVLEGAGEGDRLILSDMSQWRQSPKILLSR
jgi:HlyD family secretion protein